MRTGDTEKLKRDGVPVGIRALCHIIVGNRQLTSLLEKGYLTGK